MNANTDLVIRELKSEAVAKRFEEVNTLGMNVKREVGFAVQALRKNSYLAKAEKESILEATFNVALTGLTLNPLLNQAALVPRSVGGKIIAHLEPMYQGFITKMIDTGQATDCYAEVVYENDLFEMDMGTSRNLKHTPYYAIGKAEPGKEIGAYAVAILPDGSKKWEFRPITYVNAIMEKSESYKGDKKNNTKYSPWSNEFRPEMIKKTLIKALWKVMPKNQRAEEFAQIVAVDDEVNTVDIDHTELVDSASGEETKVKPQPTTQVGDITDKMALDQFAKKQAERVANGHIYTDEELMEFTDPQIKTLVVKVFKKEPMGDNGSANAVIIKAAQDAQEEKMQVEEAEVVEETPQSDSDLQETPKFPQEDYDDLMDRIRQIGEPTTDKVGGGKIRTTEQASDIKEALEDYSIDDDKINVHSKAIGIPNNMESLCESALIADIGMILTEIMGA